MENLALFVSQNLWFCLSFALLLAIYVIFELTQSKQNMNSLSVQHAVAEVNKNKGIYLDTRSDDEFKISHIIGAINIPEENIETNVKKLNKYKDKPIVIYGKNADKVAINLRKQEFEKVFSLKGGYGAWLQANYPIKSAQN